MRKREKGNLGRLIPEKRCTWLAYWFPPSLPPLAPLPPLSSNRPTFLPSPIDCWWARSPQTRRQPQAVRVLSVHLGALLGRRFLPRPGGEQGIFCFSQRRRKKNVLLLDMSEIKSVWLARQLWPFSMQAENVRTEWMECSYSPCTWQICGSVSI